MPRDYKNTRRSSTRAKPATPSRWRGFVVGFATGVIASAVVFVAVSFDLVSFSGPDVDRPIAQTSSSDTNEEPIDKPTFEFYSMLPEMEVAVEEVEIEHSVAEDQDSTTPASKPLEGSYLLQVGSFRKHEEADSLKASLALLGLEATIQTVSINGEQTWYRVRLGPFTERDALNQARKRLSENDFEAMVFKKRG